VPAILALITPLIALYLKFRVANFLLKIALLEIIYIAYVSFSEYMINLLISLLTGQNFPCMLMHILDKLDIFPLLALVFSYMSTIALARFMFDKVSNLL
jgi:hypothetical protein